MRLIGILIVLLIIIFVYFFSPISPLNALNQKPSAEVQTLLNSSPNPSASGNVYQQSIQKAKDAAGQVQDIENQQKQQIDTISK